MHDDAETNACRNEEWFGPEHYHYVFTGHLTCGSCNENVVVSGDGAIEEDYSEDGREYTNVLTPRFFYPPLKIIEPNVNEDVPAEVMQHLNTAFQIFWCDADSCVNRLRTVVEHLLDGLGVTRQSDKGHRLVLDARIGTLTDPKYASVKEALTSLRHMGNDGSHGTVGIKRSELLLAFSVINYCLEQLYPIVIDHTALLESVKTINEQQGFRPKG